MDIILPSNLVEFMEECIDTINSYEDPDDPSIVKIALSKFVDTLTKSPNVISEMPSYLALALFAFESVSFENPDECIFQCNDNGKLPIWDSLALEVDEDNNPTKEALKCQELIIVSKNNVGETTTMEMVYLAYCLEHLDQVLMPDGTPILKRKSEEEETHEY